MPDSANTPPVVPPTASGGNIAGATTPAPTPPKTFTLPPVPAIARPVPANPPQVGHAVTAKPSDATKPTAEIEIPSTPEFQGKDIARKQTLARIQDILAEHGNMESNIGVGHEYWTLKNYLRSLD